MTKKENMIIRAVLSWVIMDLIDEPSMSYEKKARYLQQALNQARDLIMYELKITKVKHYD
jgi:hypothetical protein